MYKTNIKPYCFPERASHFCQMSRKSNVVPGSTVELREGRSSVINHTQFIRAVADMKQRLFTTVSNRKQSSIHATQKENYNTLVSQMDELDPEKIEHENPRFGEDEVKSLCDIVRLNAKELISLILNLRQARKEAFLTN